MKTQNIKTAKTNMLLKQILFSAVVFLSFTKANAADYYWVGGTGNWTDFASHWATTSGGAAFQIAPPGPTDDVFFDGNSGFGLTDTIYIDPTGANCHDFNFSVTINPPYWRSSINISDPF